jgi:hypothetical protein
MGRKRIYTDEEKRIRGIELKRLWQLRNKDKIAAYGKKWRENNKDWFEKNHDKIKKWARKAYEKQKKETPQKLRDYNNKQRKKMYWADKDGYNRKMSCRRKTIKLLKDRGCYDNEPCEICDNYKTEIHHQDYNNPFDIIWLCHPHHMQLHKLLIETNEQP